jgi:hypothetical protein
MNEIIKIYFMRFAFFSKKIGRIQNVSVYSFITTFFGGFVMNLKHCVVVAILLAIGTEAFSQSSERNRGFYIDAGLGIGGFSYSSELNDAIKMADNAGAEHVTVALDASIGWALMQKLYLVGSITGFGDRIANGSEYVQINSYLFGPGIKWYPLSSGKYLQVGADIGLASATLLSSMQGYNVASEPGLGFKISAAYDIDWTMTGLTALFGGELLMNFIEGEAFTGYAIFTKLAFK